MEEKRSKNIVIIALCLTLIFMGVGFAALSQNLTVKTTGTIGAEQDNWKVRFTAFADDTASLAIANNQGKDTTGEAEIFTEDNTIATVNFSLTKPGDKVQYKGTITNNGSIAAELTSLTTSLKDDPYIARTVTIDGQAAATDPLVPSGLVLEAGESVEVLITYEFVDVEELPSAAHTASDTIVFGFEQAY